MIPCTVEPVPIFLMVEKAVIKLIIATQLLLLLSTLPQTQQVAEMLREILSLPLKT